MFQVKRIQKQVVCLSNEKTSWSLQKNMQQMWQTFRTKQNWRSLVLFVLFGRICSQNSKEVFGIKRNGAAQKHCNSISESLYQTREGRSPDVSGMRREGKSLSFKLRKAIRSNMAMQKTLQTAWNQI